MNDSTPRESSTQQPPPAETDISLFPIKEISQGRQWSRAHKRNNGPWFYSSSMGGRFDIREPHGTCYVANTDETAVREIVGPDFIRSGIINDAFVSDRVVSQVTLHKSIKAAKLTDPLVFQFRVTNELSNMDNYTIPQAWAAAFHTSGFNGIWYQPRFSAGKSRALAMFGPTGPAKHGYETGREMRDVVDEMLDLSVVTTQGLDQYEVLDKPEGDF